MTDRTTELNADGASHQSYVTIRGEASAEYEEKRSRFIGRAKPVNNETDAMDFVAQIKKRHYDARHNVWAYVVGGGSAARCSDDGEPQGSAGVPVLECIKKAGVADAAVVVTRYFGGTLLGVGGLVRSYTKAASAALEAAEIICLELFEEYSVTCDYSDYGRVSFELSLADTIIDSTDYAEKVSVSFAVRKSIAQILTAKLTDLLEGRASPILRGERYDSL